LSTAADGSTTLTDRLVIDNGGNAAFSGPVSVSSALALLATANDAFIDNTVTSKDLSLRINVAGVQTTFLQLDGSPASNSYVNIAQPGKGTTVLGTLAVGDAVTLSSSVSVVGATTLSSTAVISGLVTAAAGVRVSGGDLQVDGTNALLVGGATSFKLSVSSSDVYLVNQLQVSPFPSVAPTLRPEHARAGYASRTIEETATILENVR
jgi:hypothetical protein